jgi:hypothetical protein
VTFIHSEDKYELSAFAEFLEVQSDTFDDNAILSMNLILAEIVDFSLLSMKSIYSQNAR